MTEQLEPPKFEEKEIPLWQKIVAIAYLVIIAVCIWVFKDRLHADFWPLDASRVSPNILATVIQIVFWAPIVYLLWPPVRRRIHQTITRHTAPLHAHFERLYEQREQHHKEQMAKINAIHEHLKRNDDEEKST